MARSPARLWDTVSSMPEGPEIRRAADRVREAIAGRRAESVRFGVAGLEAFDAVLSGRDVVDVTSRGKAMLTRFSGGLAVYSHNQLYGLWIVARRGELPDTRRQLRLAIHTVDRSALLYSASEIEVLDAEGERRHPYLSRLGPDVLRDAPGRELLVERLNGDGFRRRQLGALLLDQGFVAGLGNYLRAEILFSAGILPHRCAADLGVTERSALAAAIPAVAQRAYRTGGVTLPDGLAERLESEGLPFHRRRFWVFRRSDEPCRRCGRPIEEGSVGGRRCFWCPSCQS